MLLVCLCGGMANRLLPLLSARRLERLYGWRVRYYWAAQPQFDAEFNHFFETDIKFGTWEDYKADLAVFGLDEFYPGEQNGVQGLIYGVLPRSVKLERNYHIVLTKQEMQMLGPDTWSVNALPGYIRSDLQSEFLRLGPRQHFLDAAAEFGTDRSIIGIHIRKLETHLGLPDQTVWVDDDRVVECLDRLASANAKQRFFLATDLQQWAHPYLARYGDRIRMRPRAEEPYVLLSEETRECRRSKTALEEAFVELLLLSRCGYIVRNSVSTYSYLAAILGGVLTSY